MTTTISLFKKFFSLFFYKNSIEALGFYSSFYLLVYELSTRKSTQEKELKVESSKNSIVYSAISMIHNNFKNDLSLNQMADDLMITPQHLARLFKGILDISFHKYLTKIRLESATYELSNTRKQ